MRIGEDANVVLQDPHRPDLYNFFGERNDPLLNNFEEHLLLMNLGNIDWRPLINLWSVLEYVTKYTAKAGKGTKQIGKMFEASSASAAGATWRCKFSSSGASLPTFHVRDTRGCLIFIPSAFQKFKY